MHWNPDEGALCADYYDVNAAESRGQSHEWFQQKSEDKAYDEIDEFLAFSRVYEVEEWVEQYQEQHQENKERERDEAERYGDVVMA